VAKQQRQGTQREEKQKKYKFQTEGGERELEEEKDNVEQAEERRCSGRTDDDLHQHSL
jgi:hypothetical protein